MKNHFEKAYSKLVQKYNKKGYLTDDDFVIITESFDIPLIMLSELQERLYNEGIVITNSSSRTEKTSRTQTKREKSYPKKKETHDKSTISIKKDKYEMCFDKMEASDPQKVKESFFDDYNRVRIQTTYIPVFILAFIENANEHGTALMGKIVSYYKSFYTERKNKSLIVERSDSIFARSEPGYDEIKRLILFNPLGRSFLKKYFRYDKQTDSICINTKFWMGMSYSDGIRIKQKSKTIIGEYYKKLSLSGSSGDDKDLAPYWQSDCKFSCSRMRLYYMFGYYKKIPTCTRVIDMA